jgi:hypothetical protein
MVLLLGPLILFKVSTSLWSRVEYISLLDLVRRRGRLCCACACAHGNGLSEVVACVEDCHMCALSCVRGVGLAKGQAQYLYHCLVKYCHV